MAPTLTSTPIHSQFNRILKNPSSTRHDQTDTMQYGDAPGYRNPAYRPLEVQKMPNFYVDSTPEVYHVPPRPRSIVARQNMPANPQGNNQQHRIVVGIDFGTTYSAIAWGDSANPDMIEPIGNVCHYFVPASS